MIAVWLGVAFAAVACAGPQASFDPSGPCETDGQAAGAYPDLEALLPRSLPGIGQGTGTGTTPGSPTTVDSGRTCTEAGLGPLWQHDVREIRFAGGTWDLGSGDGVVSAIFTTPAGQPSLDHTWMEEFYEGGARASSKTENLEFTTPNIDPIGKVWRLDTFNDASLQTVVVWQADAGVRVVLVATRVQPDASRDAHNAKVEAAVRSTEEATAP